MKVVESRAVLSYDLAMDSCPRIAGKAIHGQHDNELWKSVKKPTHFLTQLHIHHFR